MTKPMVKIDDVEREMTDAEFAQYQKDVADEQKRIADATAKQDAKTALLAKLGITADEAALLLG